MIWYLVSLLIFWKPVYYLSKYLYHTYKTKNIDKASQNLSGIKIWFGVLWSLIKWP